MFSTLKTSAVPGSELQLDILLFGIWVTAGWTVISHFFLLSLDFQTQIVTMSEDVFYY